MTKLSLLVPLDNTGFSQRIVPTLQTLFDPARFRVKLLHIAQPARDLTGPLARPAAVGVDYSFYLYNEPNLLHPIYDEEELADFRERLREDLRAQVDTFEDLGYEAAATILFGEPVKDIVAFVQDEAVDVVAMATHGRTGFERFLFGSVAQDVVKHLNVPVLLVHFGEADETSKTNEVV